MRTRIAGVAALIGVALACGAAVAAPTVGAHTKAPAVERSEPPAVLDAVQFREHAIAHLKARYPQATFKVVDQFEVTVDGLGDQQRLFLDNSYRVYLREPAGIDQVLRRLEAVLSTSDKAETLQPKALRAVIRPVGFAEAAAQMLRGDGKPNTADDLPMHRPFPGGLVILLAQDHAETFSYPARKDVIDAVGDEDAAWKRGVDNLPDAIGDIVVEELAPGLLTVSCTGSLTSSLLLVDAVWRHPDLRAVRDPVVLMLEKETLLVVDRGNASDVAGLRKIADMAAEEPHSGLFTKALLVRGKDGWVVLEK